MDVVENGQLAVVAWQVKSYDAIFMDCQMPVMDGYQATEIIREKEIHDLLFKLGANPVVQDDYKQTALFWAAENGPVTIFNKILKYYDKAMVSESKYISSVF